MIDVSLIALTFLLNRALFKAKGEITVVKAEDGRSISSDVDVQSINSADR